MFEKISPYIKNFAKYLIKTAVAGIAGFLGFFIGILLSASIDKFRKRPTGPATTFDYAISSITSSQSAIFAYSLTGLAIDKISNSVSSFVSK